MAALGRESTLTRLRRALALVDDAP
jgi:hypothetical protein